MIAPLDAQLAAAPSLPCARRSVRQRNNACRCCVLVARNPTRDGGIRLPSSVQQCASSFGVSITRPITGW
jgi:hypothetical protein